MDLNAISIKNADVFINNHKLLSDINWDVKSKEHWFILGPNGAGKTMLTNLIMGYLWPRSGGEVSILGEKFGNCNLCELRKKIAWISPSLNTWINKKNLSVEKVILSGIDSSIGFFREPSDPEKERVTQLLQNLNLQELRTRKFGNLSSGEKVKVLMARALINSPEIMILDEACVHLDLKNRENFLGTVKEIAQKPDSPTIIFITQRIEDVLPIFNKGLLLKKGKILAKGKRKDILQNETISNLFDVNLKLFKSEERYWPFIVST